MRFFLITGFGLDVRAFRPMDLPPDRFVLFDLIPALPRETLPDYALRMAGTMGAGPGDVVGGISFGGMLGLEIAKVLKPRGVVIIASATDPRYIRNRFLIWSHISMYAPDGLVRRVFAMVPWVLKRQNMLTPEGQELLTDIMTKFPVSLLRILPPKIRTWEGCKPEGIPFRQIHSTGDWLIRPPAASPDLTLLEGKNHLITVSHPKEVRRFLMETYEEFAAMKAVKKNAK